MKTINIVLILIVFLLTGCVTRPAFSTKIPKAKKGLQYFIGNATAVISIEEGKKLALQDIQYQILLYVGSEISIALRSQNVNGSGILLEQISTLSEVILKSISIVKQTAKRRKVYTEQYGMFDVYDVQIIANITENDLQRLKVVSQSRVDNIEKEYLKYNYNHSYLLPNNAEYRYIFKNKALLLTNDNDKYHNTLFTVPPGFRLMAAARSLLIPGLAQQENGEEEKAAYCLTLAGMSLAFAIIGQASINDIRKDPRFDIEDAAAIEDLREQQQALLCVYVFTCFVAAADGYINAHKKFDAIE